VLDGGTCGKVLLFEEAVGFTLFMLTLFVILVWNMFSFPSIICDGYAHSLRLSFGLHLLEMFCFKIFKCCMRSLFS